MHNSKLFSYLHTLDVHEWKDLKKHLLSSMDKRSKVFRLFLRIEKHKNDLSHKHLSIDHQHRKYYAQLERKTVLNLLSKLAMQVEHFLTLTELESDENIMDLYKAKAFNRRGLYKKANQIGKQMRSRLTDPTHLHLFYPWYIIALNHTLFFSYNPVKNTSEGPALLENCISTTINLKEYLLTFYVTEAINRESLHNEDWSEVIPQVEIKYKKENSNDKLSQCLLHSKQLTETNSKESFDKLYETFFDNTLNIDQGIAIPIYIKLKDYLTKTATEGGENTIEQLALFLYQGIVSGRSLYNNKVHPNSYLTTIVTLSVTKEFDKANELLKIGQEILPKADYIQIHGLATMNVLLRKNEINELVKIFHDIQFDQIEYKTIAIPLILRAFYQDLEDDTVFLDTQIRNFKEMLRRHSSIIPQKKVAGLNNFISILKLMIHDHDRELIRMKLKGMDQVFYRTWVEDQLEREGQQ